MAYRVRAMIAALLIAVVAAGCGLAGRDDDGAGADVAAAQTASEPTFEPVTESPSAAPPATTKPAAKKPGTPKKPSTRPPSTEPTAPAFWSELPACAHYDKTKPVSKTKVKAALKAAAARVYWRTQAPQLRVTYPLVKAVAWQESGWQSNIHNCDGGAGVMQVMPGTVEQINNFFGLAYDPAKYQDNVYVGANYLAWLTKWAGDTYFGGSYALSAGKCRTPESWCLLNVVISGYNAGQGTIETSAPSRTLPNPEYVAAVRALMTRCECDKY